MDRPIVYPGELPQDTTFLSGWKDSLYGLGFLAQAAVGTGPAVSGFGIAATSPASLAVSIGAGSIYIAESADATAYGSLGTDANTIVKQGILPAPVSLPITPPGTSGYSQVFLVEVIYQDVDTGVTVLPYFNSANPSVPFSGPSNSGSSQYTSRTGIAAVALKAGTAAPTGSQTTPAPDAGYTGLYAITVANGQSTITSANWVTLGTAPFITNLLNPLAFPHYGVDNGTANAYNVPVLQPFLASGVPGTEIRVLILNTSTGASTITLPIIGTVALTRADGSALRQGDVVNGQIASLIFDGAKCQLSGLLSTSTPPRNLQSFTTSGTFTAPFTGWYFIRLCGGGGGGGSAGNANWSGGGGGSGGYAEGWVYLIAGQNVTVTIGAGGAASANTNGAVGVSGGTTSFGAYMQATGGTGGTAGSTTCAGGTPGVGSGGQTNLYGANGGDGNPYNAEVQGGAGAASASGGGGRTTTITATAANGLAPGSGGGGVWHNGSANQTAGAGASGICDVSY